MSTKPQASMRHDRETFDSLFRRWKRSVEKDGLIQELRAREFYEKPSAIKKRAKASAKKRLQRSLAEERAKLDAKSRMHPKSSKRKTEKKKRYNSYE